jgi:hypothetical protein
MWSFNSLEDALKGLPLVQGVFSQFQAPHVGGNTNPYAASIQAEEDETIRDALVIFPFSATRS